MWKSLDIQGESLSLRLSRPDPNHSPTQIPIPRPVKTQQLALDNQLCTSISGSLLFEMALSPKRRHPERSVSEPSALGLPFTPVFGVNGQSLRAGPEGSAPLHFTRQKHTRKRDCFSVKPNTKYQILSTSFFKDLLRSFQTLQDSHCSRMWPRRLSRFRGV